MSSSTYQANTSSATSNNSSGLTKADQNSISISLQHFQNDIDHAVKGLKTKFAQLNVENNNNNSSSDGLLLERRRASHPHSHKPQYQKRQLLQSRKSVSSTSQLQSQQSNATTPTRVIPDPTRLISRLTALESAMKLLDQECTTIATKRHTIVKDVMLKQHHNNQRINELRTNVAMLKQQQQVDNGNTTTTTTSGSETIINDDDWNNVVHEIDIQSKVLSQQQIQQREGEQEQQEQGTNVGVSTNGSTNNK